MMDNTRAQFEHWFSDEGTSPKAIERGSGGRYKLMAAAQAWDIWQAATASMALTGVSRYETVRRLNPRQFAELYARNLQGENFDAMIDQLVLLRKKLAARSVQGE